MKKEKIFELWKSFFIWKQDIESIILKKLSLNKQQFFMNTNFDISSQELKKIFRKISFWYPIEYILETAEFYSLDFYVDKGCLIPRDDTEVMVEQAIESIIDNSVYIDIWTGSWAIAISVIKNSQKKIKEAYAVDISPDALKVAKKNIKTYALNKKIKLLKSDLLDQIELSRASTYIITANLPYIKDRDYENMDKEVILHEPEIALYWWEETGFEIYERLIKQIISTEPLALGTPLNKVVLFIEIGFDQKEVAIEFLKDKNLIYKVFKDNRWVARCIRITF